MLISKTTLMSFILVAHITALISGFYFGNVKLIYSLFVISMVMPIYLGIMMFNDFERIVEKENERIKKEWHSPDRNLQDHVAIDIP